MMLNLIAEEPPLILNVRASDDVVYTLPIKEGKRLYLELNLHYTKLLNAYWTTIKAVKVKS